MVWFRISPNSFLTSSTVCRTRKPLWGPSRVGHSAGTPIGLWVSPTTTIWSHSWLKYVTHWWGSKQWNSNHYKLSWIGSVYFVSGLFTEDFADSSIIDLHIIFLVHFDSVKWKASFCVAVVEEGARWQQKSARGSVFSVRDAWRGSLHGTSSISGIHPRNLGVCIQQVSGKAFHVIFLGMRTVTARSGVHLAKLIGHNKKAFNMQSVFQIVSLSEVAVVIVLCHIGILHLPQI